MLKLISTGLLISSLICYLEWAEQSAFLFEVEYGLFASAKDKANAFIHPLILVPLCGQLLLLITFFTRKHYFRLLFTGIALISPLVLMILLTGLLSLNIKIILSVLPFILLSIFAISYKKRLKTQGK